MKRATVILLAFSLVGCVHYAPQPINAAKRAEDFESRRLDGDGLRAFVGKNLGHTITNWPAHYWNLETLTLAAYYFHPSLDVARAQWRVAEATAISAGARPNPTVSFAPGLTANSPAGVTPWLMAAGFDWPVETAGKRGLRVTQAKQLACVARFNLVSTAWQVRANARDSLAAYRFAGNQSGTLDEKVGLQKQIVAKLEERFKAGAISLSEVTPSRVALGKLEAELGAARENEIAAAARLAEAIGISLRVLTNTPKEMTLYTPMLSAAQIAEAKKRALLTRADLLAALAEYDASETALRLEIAKQYPDVHFNPNYEYDQGANKWRLGLSLELPVLNRNKGPIAQAKAKRDEAAAKFTALQAKVISDIDAAAQSFQQLRRRYFEMIPAINAELGHERAMEAQQRAGAVDALDVLAVKLERQNGAALWDEAAYRHEVAFGQLEDAVQQLLEVRPEIIAPAPPTNLEINPREPKAKP
ncbi:MAG: TolC family protein [Verrucomicrobia bacterium]|nr:MAG: TolC family protein [Verrucomicrobiota bacterium]